MRGRHLRQQVQNHTLGYENGNYEAPEAPTVMIARPYRSPNRRHDRQFFYKYMTTDVAKIVLATRKLRWSSPLLFNDPFDITQELRLNFDEADLNAVLADRMASLIERGEPTDNIKRPEITALLNLASGMSPDARRNAANELRQNIDEPTIGQIESMEALKEKRKEMVPRFRVLCFSELNDVTPMWHHYAEKYEGVVLEFSAVDELDSPFLIARPVVYQDGPPSIADPNEWASCLLGEATYEDLFTDFQYVKTSPWAYEMEWRIASFAKPEESGLFGDFGFSPLELTGVYLGPECSSEKREDLLALLVHGLEHVRVYETLPDTQQAKFTFRAIEGH